MREVGDKVKSGFACNILGAFEVLYGKGEHLKEMTADFESRFREQGHTLEVQRRTWEWWGGAKKMTGIGE